jgi:hypothetical protein
MINSFFEFYLIKKETNTFLALRNEIENYDFVFHPHKLNKTLDLLSILVQKRPVLFLVNYQNYMKKPLEEQPKKILNI